jgi:hypothetical protein
VSPNSRALAALAAVATIGACGGEAPSDRPTTSPSPSLAASPSSTPIPPVLYFNLTEDDALAYLEALDERIEDALHDGELGALNDLYTADGPARPDVTARIVRTFRRGLVDRTRHEVTDTKVVRIRSQLAVFRQTRLVHPCVYTYANRFDVTPDPRVLRQVVVRYMADENLNWKIDREVIVSERPTGQKVIVCP